MAVRTLILALLVIAAPGVAAADEAHDRAAEEIEHLIAAVGDSGCDFIRNGKRHDAAAAASHLRMKYRRARRHATTAERFIERLASRSSMTRRPYLMDCPGDDTVPVGDWLRERLAAFRTGDERTDQAATAPAS